MTTLDGYGEDRLVRALIAQLRRRDPSVLAGPGDDCAVVRATGAKFDTLLKTDAVVEGVHFTSETDPRLVGRKALCRAISDVAAMGGKPCHALITLALPAEKSVAWVQALYAGLQKTARAFRLTIAGGETVRSPGGVFISVALTGRVGRGKAILRSGGQRGDALLVTGRLGGSIAGWHLRFQPRLREARWLGKHFDVHAMMDLSDGLGADLPRLAAASRLGYELAENSVPRRKGATLEQALNDGEDYELLFSLPFGDLAELQRQWRLRFPNLRLSQIGRLQARSSSEAAPAKSGGFQHFGEKAK